MYLSANAMVVSQLSSKNFTEWLLFANSLNCNSSVSGRVILRNLYDVWIRNIWTFLEEDFNSRDDLVPYTGLRIEKRWKLIMVLFVAFVTVKA